jgi:hypothetical protein
VETAQRREVEQILGRTLAERELWFLKGRYGEDLDWQQADDLAADLKEQSDSSTQAARFRERPSRRVESVERAHAVSDVIAAQARTDERITEFRRKHLSNGVRPWDNTLGAWLQAQTGIAKTKRDDLLAYAEPDFTSVRNIAIRNAGMLGDLKALTRYCTNTYAWDEAQSTVFVLTDTVPLLEPIQARVDTRWHVPAASRIVLTIDPWTDPKEVANYYQRVRIARAGEGKRFRPVQQKALRLASFYAQRPRDEASSASLKAWNKDAPKEWRYSDVKAFVRAAKAATEHILDPKII